MKRLIPICLIFLFLAGCQPVEMPTLVVLPSETPSPIPSDTPQLVEIPAETVTPQPSTTPSALLSDRPVFLAWPLPSSIGTARITQFPNTAWSWHFLGLNPGYQCPPMFGYLLNPESWPFWRDTSIPEAEDKAQADPHTFEMVECYDDGSGGHAGTDIKALAGTPVYAAAYGQVLDWRAEGITSMIVLKHCLVGSWNDKGDCEGGRQWYTTYMHIIPDPALLHENTIIPQGTQLGVVLDQGDNSHLHFEVGEGLRSYANFINPWGTDAEPWQGCMWMDQALCVYPNPATQRLAVFNREGQLLLQRAQEIGQPTASVQALRRVRLWGKRTAYQDADGHLYLLDDNGNWMMAAEGVQDFQISDTRTAILTDDGTLWVLEQFQTSWMEQAKKVISFSVSDTRLAYVDSSGDLYVKEGDLTKDWQALAENVRAVQVTDSRVAYVNHGLDLYVNEGDLTSEFQLMGYDVVRFEISGSRMGMINTDAEFYAKQGKLSAEWVLQSASIQDFQLADTRLMMQDTQGLFFFKEGSLYGEWFGLPYIEPVLVAFNGEQSVPAK